MSNVLCEIFRRKDYKVSTTIQQVPVVSYEVKPQKSDTGKQIGLFTGTFLSARELSKGDFYEGIHHNLDNAVKNYNQNKKTVHNMFTKKEYVKDYIKTAKLNKLTQSALGAGVMLAGGLLAGNLIDKAIDAVKNHKSEKPQQNIPEEE